MVVSIRTVGTFVLTCVLSVTVAVLTGVLVSTMNSNVDDMVDASHIMADEFAEMFLFERVTNMREQVGEHVFGPVQHFLILGSTSFKLYNYSESSMSDVLRTCRSMLALADQLDSPRFLTEVSFLSFKSANPNSPETELGVKMILGEEVGDTWKVKQYDFASGKFIWFNDSIPLPLHQIKEEPLVNDIDLNRHLDLDDYHFARSWSKPRLSSDSLRISLALPLRPEQPSYSAPWIITDFSLVFIRKLLQSLASVTGEPSTPLAYDKPNYTPKTDENILCIVEQDTSLIVECTHGFASIPAVGGGWGRVIANQSDHPVIGPVFEQLGSLATVSHSKLFKFDSVGTARFPMAPETYFVKSISLTHAHEEEEDDHDAEADDHDTGADDHNDGHHKEDHDEAIKASPPWLGIAIIPRSKLLQTFEKTTSNVEDSGRRGTVIALVVAFVIMCVALVTVYLYETALVRPLVALICDMREVEQMNIDHLGDAYRNQTTIFSEVNGIRTSFIAMVDMLIEYKAFMPSYLVVTDNDESEDQHTVERRSVCSGMTSLSSTVVVPAPKASMFALDLNHQYCSFLTAAVSFDDSNPSAGYNKFLSVLLSNGAKLHPHITVSGRFIQVAFNAPMRVLNFSDKGLACATAIEREKFSFVKGLSYEVADVEAGNVGCHQQKWFLIRTNRIVESRALSLYAAHKNSASIFCDEAVTLPRYSGTQYLFSAFEVINVSGAQPAIVYRLMGLRKRQDEEWMYTMNSEEGTMLSKFNKGFSLLVSGQFEAAKEYLEDCRGGNFANLNALLRSVDGGKPYQGIAFPFHEECD